MSNSVPNFNLLPPQPQFKHLHDPNLAHTPPSASGSPQYAHPQHAHPQHAHPQHHQHRPQSPHYQQSLDHPPLLLDPGLLNLQRHPLLSHHAQRRPPQEAGFFALGQPVMGSPTTAQPPYPTNGGTQGTPQRRNLPVQQSTPRLPYPRDLMMGAPAGYSLPRRVVSETTLAQKLPLPQNEEPRLQPPVSLLGLLPHLPYQTSSGSQSRTYSLTGKLRSFVLLAKLATTRRALSHLLHQQHTAMLLQTQQGPLGSHSPQLSLDRTWSTATRTLQRTILTTSLQKPKVYPALLSRVAVLLRALLQVGTRTKNGLNYNDAFTGREAVDMIARLIRTTDRNLALLLGRALDAQNFFRDVTYEHRLRDSPHEVYLFVDIVVDNHMLGEYSGYDSPAGYHPPQRLVLQITTLLVATGLGEASTVQTSVPVNGVFTLLTNCYSPTCTRNRLCYLIACPRRLEQQARLNMKPGGGLQRLELRVLMNGDNDVGQQKELWLYLVPELVRESVSKEEQSRQEVLFEIMSNERDFVRDMEYLRDFWIRPLRLTNIIPELERERFIRVVFSGILDILVVNYKFAEALTRRQKQQYIVDGIGDIMVEFIPRFEAFLPCCAGQVFSKYHFERQRSINPNFEKFVRDTQNLEALRNLEFILFLLAAFNRPGRYYLLLKTLSKHTPELNPDYKLVNEALQMMKALCDQINELTGRLQDRYKTLLLRHKLTGYDQDDAILELRLRLEHRRIADEILLRRKAQDKEDGLVIEVTLLDNALLFVKRKTVNRKEFNKVFQRPIPLPLLYASSVEDDRPLDRALVATTLENGLLKVNRQMSQFETRLAILFVMYGRRGFLFTLYAANLMAVKNFIQLVYEAQTSLVKQNSFITVLSIDLLHGFGVDGRPKVNCASVMDGGTKLVYGTDDGIYVQNMRQIAKDSRDRVMLLPMRIIDKGHVTQILELTEYGQIVALCDKKLYVFGTDVLVLLDVLKNSRSGRELMTHVLFFRSGLCNGNMVVCAVGLVRSGQQGLMRVFNVASDTLVGKRGTTARRNRLFSEYRDYVFLLEPLSVLFLLKQLVVGCADGFEVLLLATGERQALLDEADSLLVRVFEKGAKKELRPILVHRIRNEFLLCYTDQLFYINQNGWKLKGGWKVTWNGEPLHFVVEYPYLFAFDQLFIEVRHCETGELLRAVVGENIRFLHSLYREIWYVLERNGRDNVSRLDIVDEVKNAAK